MYLAVRSMFCVLCHALHATRRCAVQMSDVCSAMLCVLEDHHVSFCASSVSIKKERQT